MKKFKLSPSSLKLMDDCPRCFWLAQNKVWKRPSGIFPTLPSGMDRVLKNHFDSFMEKGILPPELSENADSNDFKLFDNVKLLKIWRNNFKGIAWTDGNGNNLHGAVDNIMVNGKKLIVLDYKTRGYPLKENTASMNQNQLDIYNFLLRKKDYETEDFAFLLYYIPEEVMETGEVIFDTTLVKMNVNVENAERLFNDAITLLNDNCPEKACEWCELVKK